MAFSKPGRLGYQGDFAIEREAGDQRVADIIAAKNFATPLIPA